MKLIVLLIFCLCLFFVQENFSQTDEFYTKVLEDSRYGRNSYFVSLEVKSQKYTGKVIATNGDLYLFFYKTRKFNQEQYKSFMLKLLSNKEALQLKQTTLDMDGYFLKVKGFKRLIFMPVNKNDKVQEVAVKGCKEFIDYYFEYLNDGYELKNNLGFEERNAIINKLFEWQIPSFISDIPGLLTIRKDDLKCPSR